MFTVATGAMASASVAFAQAGAADDGALEEVVVTATRQADTVNRVPLSVSAQTQRTLDQQGIRNIADLTGAVPALNVSQGAPGVAFVSIRGIQNNGQGAATTGFYLDDTPITKRGAFGCGLCTGNGTPIPPLFDLDRVEVLRGPQGTLFGSGSQGGTIRYITPQPSLTRYSTYVRLEASDTWNGKPSYEGGVALGGPIIQDKLGFRASIFHRHTGGWLDYVNRATGQQWAKDANDGDTTVFRGAVTWAPVERARITAAYFSSRDHWDSRSDTYYLPTNAPINEPEACYSGTGTQLPSCSAPGVAYRRGPLSLPALPSLGKHTSLDPFLFPATTNFQVGSLTADYDFEKMTVRSITSYIDDQTKIQNWDGGALLRRRATNADFGGILVRNLNSYAGLGAISQDVLFGRFYSNNRRYGLTQEVRFSSAGDARPLSWVAGVYYSNQRNTQRYDNTYQDLDLLQRSLFGISAAQSFRGAGPYVINGVAVGFDAKYQTMKDTEVAAFGELNYWITEKLKATVGIRVSHLGFEYYELHYGPASGANDPRLIQGGITGPLSVTEDPIAPKVGLQYQITDNDMVYVTAAKGFRAGGVNSTIPEAVCGLGLAAFGETVNGLPQTYGSDTVWSYEGGAKLRVLDNRVQFNGSLYRIDWSNIQTNVTIPAPCGIPFTTNAGKARSQGFEVEAQARVTRGLTANVSVAYNDAKYSEAVVGLGRPGFNQLFAALDGQKLQVPPLTIQLGARYDVEVAAGMRAYARVDWRYLKHWDDTATQLFGASGYSPDYIAPSTQRTNIRLGIERGAFDVNFFVNNLFNSRKGYGAGGYGSCPGPAAGGTAACTGGLYNPYFTAQAAAGPRQIGLQIAYRR